ncbi:MAG: nucleoside monophosphate kinase [Candidatus Omnitrophica bacterium]|nr:nucleoside monophosphate kinase [Candidatus Omnitrophota bacterium]
MKYNTVLLFGAPGAGKGTQGKVLGTVPGYFHIACGDVFRNLTVESELGRVFLEYSGRGELVPDEYTIRLWREAVEGRKQGAQFQPKRDMLVLDGLPRSLTQAQMLADALNVLAIFNLICPDRSKLIARLQRRALRENRLDDVNYEVILQRLDVYERETKPVLDFYGAQLVHTIDATQPPIVVLHQLLEVLTKL